MPVTPDLVATETSAEAAVETSVAASVTRSRATLSVRSGTASRPDVASTAGRRVSVDRTGSGGSLPGTQNGVVPLKRLTAGRKEIKIAHDGATYLLRITKSNKLILTKTEAKQAASTS